MYDCDNQTADKILRMIERRLPSDSGSSDTIAAIHGIVIIIMCIIGIVSFSAFGGYRLLRHDICNGLIDFTLSLFLLLNLLYIRKKTVAEIWQRYTVYVLTVYFLYIFTRIEFLIAESLWVLAIPLFSSYIVGLRRGLILTSVSFAVILIVFRYTPSDVVSATFKIHFCTVFLFETILAYAFGMAQSLGVYLLKNEITQRKATRRQVLEEKEYIENLYRIVPCAIISINPEGSVVSFNAEAEKLTGYSAAEAVGQSCTLWADQTGTEEDGASQTGCGGEFRESECVIRRKDGEQRYIIKNGVPISDNEGNCRGMIESFIDITDRKVAEKELVDAKILAENESRKANEASKAKSVFLTMMTHEIRTPLNGIIGLNNLMLETSLTNEQHEFIEGIRQSAEMLLALINDILDFSKIESGNVRIDHIDFNLRTMVEDAMDGIACKAIGKDVDIHTLLHASVPAMVRGDPTRIRQVIGSIAGNAVKFTESGEVILVVKVEKETSQKVNVRFEVTDTGIGITSDQMNMLFKPFSQVDSRLSRKYSGTGLGLALSKKVVQMLGGQIGLSSSSGKGSTFWFSLELEKSDKKEKELSVYDTVAGMNILVADQSPSGRKVITHYLEQAGCFCHAFASSEEALAVLDENRKFDAMILTMQQVGTQEQELIRKIKIRAMLKSMPLVLITAMGKRGDAEMVKETGVAAYLTRPLKLRQLLECLVLLKGYGAEQETEAYPTAGSKSLITRHTLAEIRTEEKFHILVVEDNAVNRKIVKKFIDKAGFGCDFAENGADAVEAYGKKRYDMILMDCLMPVMSGFDATIAIREIERKGKGNRNVPICALTANVDISDQQHCYDVGMDDYLPKPLNYSEFLTKLKYWQQKVNDRRQ